MRRTLAVSALVAATLVLPASASATHNLLKIASLGPNGGNGALDAAYMSSSTDGSTVLFVTQEALVSTDADSAYDVYKRSGNTTTLVSTGPNGGDAAQDALFVGSSADGTRVFFETDESMVSSDTDTTSDVYERVGSTTNHLSLGTGGTGNAAQDAFLVGNTRDGSKVWFISYESLVPGDNDSLRRDIYERSGSTLTQVSVGPNSTNGPYGAEFAGATEDGSHVFFYTDEPFVSSDTDAAYQDVYDRSGGNTSHVSTGPNGGSAPLKAFFGGATPDGTHVYFITAEALVNSDTDSTCPDELGNPTAPCTDVYERTGGVTALISTSSTSPNGAHNADFAAASSDGFHVMFTTDEPLDPVDTDNGCPDENQQPTERCIDLYDRSGGGTTLVSTSPTNPHGTHDATYEGASQDFTRIFFSTTEPLGPGDLDTVRDIYERSGTTTTQLSVGQINGNGPYGSRFHGSSADGTRVFFSTFENLTSTDTDANWRDIYERSGGRTSFVSTKPGGSNGVFNAIYAGNSEDGSVVWFGTAEPLVPGDTDTREDVYSNQLLGYAAPQSAGQSTVPIVPVFAQCGTVANPSDGRHSPPFSVSCLPPAYTAGQVAHIGPQSAGQAQYTAIPGDANPFNGDQADLSVVASLTDVRSGSGSGADYPASLTSETRLRVTDLNSTGAGCGSAPTCGGSTVEVLFRVPMSCTTTPLDPLAGSSCSVSTTVDAVTPGYVSERKAAVWQMFRVLLRDSGNNGVRGDTDDKLFAQQGYYVP